ncbi:MAG: Glycosyltransferase, family GT2 [archaeon GW2011_AR20]|nr:MAG: Glycosyltransferase, family GT2 [archaeon GW2011_AR20]AQS28435.1 hypothetical protein [uncultured archaeon]MBS3160272.1 glycosyltransferase [Candidatus Woesearchaeota archaeon]
MISFIIPAYDEERYIGKTLAYIPDEFEKIVVCNGCTDSTYNLAKKYARVLNLSEKNVSKARNLGAMVAKNNFLVFLDADTRLSKKAYESLLRLKEKNVVGTFKVKFNKNTFSSNFYSMIKNIFPYFKLHNASGVIFCSRKIFDLSGGFNENSIKHENHEFTERAKKHGAYYYSRNYVVTSARRYEKLGYMKILLYWIKEMLIGNKEYPSIR